MGNIKYILSGHVQRLINEEKLTQFIKREEKNHLQQFFDKQIMILRIWFDCDAT